VATGDDLKVRLKKADDGSIVRELHHGFYYIGRYDPIREYLLFASQATENITVNSATPTLLTLTGITPTEGAPIVIKRDTENVDLAQHSIPPSEYNVEVHTVVDSTRNPSYEYQVFLYHDEVDDSSLEIAVYSGGAWGSWTTPSDFVFDDGYLLLSSATVPAVTTGDVIRVRYNTTNSFSVIHDSDGNRISGRTVEIAATSSEYTMYYEAGYPSATPGEETYREVDMDLRPLEAGARTGFLYLDDLESEPVVVFLVSPWSADTLFATPVESGATPYIVRAPIQSYGTVASTPWDVPVVLSARVLDVYGNPCANKTVVWTVHTTTPEMYVSTTDMDGVATVVLEGTITANTPVSASCDGAVDGGNVLRQQADKGDGWESEVLVNISADELANYRGTYIVCAWAHDAGKPRTYGEMIFQSRPYSKGFRKKKELEWQNVSSYSDTGEGVATTSTPTGIACIIYTPSDGDEEIRAGLDLANDRWSRPIILRKREGEIPELRTGTTNRRDRDSIRQRRRRDRDVIRPRRPNGDRRYRVPTPRGRTHDERERPIR
jgi:hypothetical protein